MNLADLNWKAWSLVFAIALGGTFELLKRIPTDGTTQTWAKETLLAPILKPYAAKIRPRVAGLKKNQPPARLPAPAMKVQQPPAPAPKAVIPDLTKEQLAALLAKAGQAAEKDKKGEDEYEEVLDPKTGKMVKRKKKKKKVAKKKKDEPKKEEVGKSNEQKVADDQGQGSSDADIDLAITRTLQTGRIAPANPDQPDDAFESAEEWIKRLLNRPSLSETNRFIDHYKKHLVTTEVFYKVVTMMLQDSRAEMKKLGVLAAAAIPSAMSFRLLADASQNSRNDESVKQKATEALNSYAQIGRVGYLKQILASSGSPPYLTLKATQLVETAAQQYLGAQQSSGTPPQPATQVGKNTFQAFIPILGNLSRTATDPGVKSAAGQTLARLEELLKTGSTTTAVAQQTPTN